MKFNRAQLIDYHFEQIQNKEMDFSQLRPILQEMGIETDEVNIIIKQIDKQLQHTAIQKSHKMIGRNIFYSGLLLSVIGVIILAATLFNALKGGVMIYYFAIIIAGLSLAMAGRSKMHGRRH